MSDEYEEILQRARQLAEEQRPEAAVQKKSAFANSVAYLATGWSGGYGGPSGREHPAARQEGPRGRRSF